MAKVFLEQPLASPGSAKYCGSNRLDQYSQIVGWCLVQYGKCCVSYTLEKAQGVGIVGIVGMVGMVGIVGINK